MGLSRTIVIRATAMALIKGLINRKVKTARRAKKL
jgi:hypothetical protein